MAYKSLFFLTPIAKEIIRSLNENDYIEHATWDDYLGHMCRAVRSHALTSNMLTRCLRELCPSPFPKKFQVGGIRGRVYHVNMPDPDKMRRHLRGILPHHLQPTLKD